MRRHNRSIYGCTQAPAEFKAPSDCRLTWNPDRKRLYVHIFAWPYKHLFLEGMAGRMEYAQLLNDGSEVSMTLEEWYQHQGLGGKDAVVLTLPQQKPEVAVPVVELFLK
jgi:alpha-L-fucosidase